MENTRFGKRLVKAGLVTQEQLDEALAHPEAKGERVGEVLVRLGYASEAVILQFLGAVHQTRYVSTERLARARIPQQVLDLLPVHLAERYNLIPVLYDAETSTLSIVASEPQNEENLREVHILTSVRELRVYVALHQAVKATLRKHYRGEINAFKDLLYHMSPPVSDFTNPYLHHRHNIPFRSPSAEVSGASYASQAHRSAARGSGVHGRAHSPSSPHSPAVGGGAAHEELLALIWESRRVIKDIKDVIALRK